MQKPTFTVDWTSERVAVWEPFLKSLAGQPRRAIEIGTFEGRTAVWLMVNVLTHPGSRLICIDPYAYTERQELKKLQRARRRAIDNLGAFGPRVDLRIARSVDVLPTLPARTFDLVYVDGQHTAGGCMYDLVRSWTLLKEQGIVIVDDVDLSRNHRARKWGFDSPRTAVTDFVLLGLPHDVLWDEGNTIGIRKVRRRHCEISR